MRRRARRSAQPLGIMARLLGHFGLCLLIPLAALGQSNYTDDMYRRGLEKHRTAPLFVLITLVDPKDGSERAACVDARQLLGAIHVAHGIPHDAVGNTKAMAIALNQPGRRFSFENTWVQSNLRPLYSAGLGRWWREKLKDKSEVQLRAGLEQQGGELHTLYRTIGTQTNSDALHAVCQVLLERGILVGQSDVVAQLYLEE